MAKNELMTYVAGPPPMTVEDMKAQVNLIQHVMAGVMKDGEHYGKIPGCGDRPTLLKSGAEKLAMTFRFAVDPDVEIVEFQNYHREYRVRVRITNTAGEFLGAGVGCASTLESKYRFRTGPLVFSENVVPKAYWDMKKEDPTKAQGLIGGRGFIPKKGDNGIWYICTQGEKCEHDNPSDYWNTILKMGKKRALVDAILTVTAASDIFTQDIEDAPELYAKTEVPVDHPAAAAELTKQKDLDEKKKAADKKAADEKKKATAAKGQTSESKDTPATPQDTTSTTQEKPATTAAATKIPATQEELQNFWEVFQALAEATGDDRDETIRVMSEGKVDPLAIDEVPATWILKLTYKGRDLLKNILGE